MDSQFENPKFANTLEANQFHGNCYKQVAADTPYPRVVFATKDGYINLIKECLRIMPEPFHVMYVLIRPMQGIPGGRYLSDEPFSRKEMDLFLNEYGSFFENDGRHHVYFISDDPETFLVYDHHNMIYAYGQQENFLNLLRNKNYSEEEPEVKNPHYHGFNHNHVVDERNLIASRDWTRHDLTDMDDS
ncbi:MAG: hypothetical protein KIT34_00695 [Cyanobacteria bacterium TGS_CYA1]|nr:hypothetical protein [Cyanobacteria bacterium TGS_CYA1]